MYFERNPEAYFLADDYSQEQRDILGKLPRLCREVRVIQRKADPHGHVELIDKRCQHSRGVNGFDPDCQIDGLEHALNNITREKATFIWNKLLIPNRQHVRGIVESSRRKTFEDCEQEKKNSPVGELAMRLTWVNWQ